ncbi:DUF2339 domain-containing protein [Phycicoccus duodecadis]|uniref:Putative membrane protein DUF2339 n=1 Tax=Phycicoccus duodecadis TaxID=173053 RepID=A0A2N3YL08_9MICO|nr:DUF2339 domain-containing protein [Phycicoccus duodecadis]PKW27550.1 putative membrane protein DUF2339 [Phycicoccus duodecadis]
MTHRDQVLQLEREFADAMQRMYTVGNGLARLRADLEQTSPAAAPAAAPAMVAAVPAAPVRPAAPSPVPPPAVPREPWYRREGAITRVLAVAGAGVTLFGVALLLVLAVRQGWFGPGARVAAGAGLAVVLGALGTRGGARDRGRGAAVGSAPVALVATGAAAAYLDVVAVTALYGWVPPVVGLALCAAVAVAGLRLARVWSSELLAVLMVAGAALLSPVVAGDPGWLLCAVLAVLSLVGWWAGAAAPAPRLTVVRSVPVGLALVAGSVGAADQRLGLLAVAAVVLVTTLATSALSLRRHPGAVADLVAVGVAVVGVLAVCAAQADALRTLSYAATAAVLMLAAATGRRAPLGPLPAGFVATTTASGAVAAVLAVLSGAPQGFVATGLLLLALGQVAAAGATRSRISLGVAAGLSLVALAAWSPHPVAMLSLGLARGHDLPVAFVDSGLAVALVALLAWAVAGIRGIGDDARRAVRVATLPVALVAGATMVVSVLTLAGARFGDAPLGFVGGHAISTVGWMVVAGGLLLRSLDRPDPDLTVRLGLALVAVAVGKLFLFDLAALDGVVRSLAFIVTGLLLLAIGSRYARAWEQRRRSA